MVFFYRKKFYQIKKQFEYLSERERMLVFSILFVLLFMFWYSLIFHWQAASLQKLVQEKGKIEEKIALVKQKKLLLETLSQSDAVKALLRRYAVDQEQMQRIDEKMRALNADEINGEALSVFLHEALENIQDVSIDNFSTVVSQKSTVIDKNLPENAEEKAKKNIAAFEPVHYSLSIKGSYFAIMAYLKRLENLNSRLYWDSFEYKVLSYPLGLSIIKFYTLKPRALQKMAEKSKDLSLS